VIYKSICYIVLAIIEKKVIFYVFVIFFTDQCNMISKQLTVTDIENINICNIASEYVYTLNCNIQSIPVI